MLTVSFEATNPVVFSNALAPRVEDSSGAATLLSGLTETIESLPGRFPSEILLPLCSNPSVCFISPVIVVLTVAF
ncbi:hypothetical protein MtrunA17_Chr1g0206671 [Medicago truncatula]|uniref:Uncharacterized protein n=1 Tax=Medicago truncatula TaxID=3880 RepID=A0A396K1P0_MEDTR|nr:hypothetical protein MtrunA17_Chr1g0206671 [Medicago truncatula]